MRRTHRGFPAILFLLLFFSASACAQQAPPQPITDLRPTLILISIDAFRADYLTTKHAPTLQSLARSGASGPMQSAFPTLTFPNHYSIATGLYPAQHGIVSNIFRDPQFPGVTFKSSDDAVKQQPHWWLGEPIWVTAEKQHQHAGTLFWPGSDVEIDGVRPSHYEPYKKDRVPEETVEEMFRWIDLPVAQRPTLFSIYFEDVDHAGHDFGPASKEVDDAVQRVDSAIQLLLQGLRLRGVADKVNLVIVSDHGMAQLSRSHTVILDDYIDLNDIDVTYPGPVLQFYVKSADPQSVLGKMERIPHMALYAKQDTPARWHYRQSPRITPYLGLMDEGWTIASRKKFDADPKFATGGAHGYDNSLASMRAIFIAHGPAFNAGSSLPLFENVNLYSLFTYLLGLKPAGNSGNLATFAPVLKRPVHRAARAAAAIAR